MPRFYWYWLLTLLMIVRVSTAAARIGIAAGAVLLHLLLAFRRWRLLSKPVRQVVERGVPVVAALIQANRDLFKPGPLDLPCLVLFTFDPQRGSDSAYLMEMAARVGSYKETQQTDPELQYVAELTTNERAYLYRRRRLPDSFTGGVAVYVADLWIARDRLKEGYLRQRLLPCLAEPGEKGGLELVPWWIAEGRTGP